MVMIELECVLLGAEDGAVILGAVFLQLGVVF